jgi:hypothetical protein
MYIQDYGQLYHQQYNQFSPAGVDDTCVLKQQMLRQPARLLRNPRSVQRPVHGQRCYTMYSNTCRVGCCDVVAIA